MKNVRSVANLCKTYHWAFLLYFVFFLADGGMEAGIPFFFTSYGFLEEQYGFFLSCTRILDVCLPLFIVYLSKRWSPLKIYAIFIAIVLAASWVTHYSFHSFAVAFSLMVVYCTRPVFNYSIGNLVNLSIQSETRSQFFAIRDIFLYTGVSLSTFLAARIIAGGAIRSIYLFLSPLLLFSVVLARRFSRSVHHTTQLSKNHASLKKFIKELRQLSRDKFFGVLLLFEIASLLYSVIMQFIPLLMVSRGINPETFLDYSAIFSIISCLGAMVLTTALSGLNARKVFIADFLMDVISLTLFLLPGQDFFLLAGYYISLFKDVLSPISFGYLYSCVEQKYGLHRIPSIFGLLNTYTNLLGVLFPILIGILWEKNMTEIFVASSLFYLALLYLGHSCLPEVNG